MDAIKITHDTVPQGLTLLLEKVSELIELHKTPAPNISTTDKVDNELLTRQQVADRLKISLPTLNELTKNGKITGYRIGNRVRYKATEVQHALTQIKTTSKA